MEPARDNPASDTETTLIETVLVGEVSVELVLELAANWALLQETPVQWQGVGSFCAQSSRASEDCNAFLKARRASLSELISAGNPCNT